MAPKNRAGARVNLPEFDGPASTADYWAAYEPLDALAAERYAVAGELPMLLTDAELNALSADVDDISPDNWDDIDIEPSF